jgi:hypothetical protein
MPKSESVKLARKVISAMHILQIFSLQLSQGLTDSNVTEATLEQLEQQFCFSKRTVAGMQMNFSEEQWAKQP